MHKSIGFLSKLYQVICRPGLVHGTQEEQQLQRFPHIPLQKMDKVLHKQLSDLLFQQQ